MYSSSMRYRVMTVSGSGEVTAEPDLASIQLGVVTEGQELTQLQQENARVMEQVIASVINLGIPRESLETVDYSIVPQYDYESGTQVFRGYQITNMISIKTENISQTGEVIDTAVDYGANQIRDIHFSIENSEAFYQQALALALRDAYMKAATMGRSMRLQVDHAPLKVIERSQHDPIPLARAQTFAAATPIEPGELNIEAAVEVQFQFFA
ncbi:SIMPL domain-containing protein [Halobacillus sp. Marseille-P3879]|uniref:SIMPL domain-containing protein n=1 Tax=Halobacillus sp. Marseille-P3879 TaxID=2045014 RepID=UPI00135AEC8A|nr:SIMPL domain-containing protein [Halobacillus sp. Marseille-P3879]